MKNHAQIIERKDGTRHRLSDLGAIFLCDIYDRLEGKRFCYAMAHFAGLAELLAGNNAPELYEIKRMVASEAELNRIRKRVHEA